METEKQLLQAIAKGDRVAFRRLYERFAGHAMAVALRYMGSPDDAQDVVQDAFVKVLTKVGGFTYRGEGSLKSWVMRIVVNTALDSLRDRTMLGVQVELPDMPEEEASPPVDRVPPGVLNRMIGELPPGYRTVLNLHVFEGYSHQRIGELLGIRENTSASQLTRAKQLLARRISEYLKQQTTDETE